MNDEKNWLAADYVLGVLRGAERVAFEKSLANDSELAQRVLEWQKRLEVLQPAETGFHPGMSDAEVDSALGRVFEKVCAAIDADPNKQLGNNPLKGLSAQQLAGLRPVVTRLIASYLILLERLKAQQAGLATGGA